MNAIRTAMSADTASLARLNVHIQNWHAAHYPETFLPDPDPKALAAHFAARLADPTVTALLAGEPPVGYVLCTLQVREASIFSPSIRRLLIEHIAVAPEARRQGHGRALLDGARHLARDLNADEILLDTWEANHEAHAFFRAASFHPRRMLFRATP